MIILEDFPPLLARGRLLFQVPSIPSLCRHSSIFEWACTLQLCNLTRGGSENLPPHPSEMSSPSECVMRGIKEQTAGCPCEYCLSPWNPVGLKISNLKHTCMLGVCVLGVHMLGVFVC